MQSFELALRDAGIQYCNLGIQFDPKTAWDERKDIFKITGLIIKTANITQSATRVKAGLWTTTIAAAGFINEKKENP